MHLNISKWTTLTIAILMTICVFGSLSSNKKTPDITIHFGGNAPISSDFSDSIFIGNNSDLITFPNKTGGGTPGNPYIIRDLIINGSVTGFCMWIENTNLSLVIMNCTLTGSAGIYNASIMIANSSNVQVHENHMYQDHYAIQIVSSSYCNITNNTFGNDTGYKVRVKNSSGIVINGNNMTGTGLRGIWIEYSTCGEVRNNTISNQTCDIVLQDVTSHVFSGNLLGARGFEIADSNTTLGLGNNSLGTTNTLDGNPILHYKGQVGLNNTNFTNAAQIFLENCTNSTLLSVPIHGPYQGLVLSYCSNMMLESMNFSSSFYPLWVLHSRNLTFNGSTFQNANFAFRMYNCTDVIVSRSYFDNNEVSFDAAGSCTNITLVHNDFLNVHSFNVWFRGINENISVMYNIFDSNLWGAHLDLEYGKCTVYNNTFKNGRTPIQGEYIHNSSFYQNLMWNTSHGIDLRSSSGNWIENNTIFLKNITGGGVELYDSHNNIVKGNFISSSLPNDGIYLSGSNWNTIENNSIQNATTGMEIRLSGNNTIFNNTLWWCQQGIYVYRSHFQTISTNNISRITTRGITLESCDNCTITRNVVSTCSYAGIRVKNNCHFTNVTGNDISTCGTHGMVFEDQSGLYIETADYSILSGNVLSGNYYGICARNSDGINISSNTAWNCTIGIYTYDTEDSIVFNNTIFQCHEEGMYLYMVFSTITGNQVCNNTGIGLYAYFIWYSNITRNVAKNNTASGISIYNGYCSKYSENHVENNSVGFFIQSSTDSFINNTVIRNHGIGIHLNLSYNISISFNLVSFNEGSGISITGASYSTFAANDIFENEGNGIEIRGLYNHVIQNNITSNKLNGVVDFYTQHTLITENNISTNNMHGIYLNQTYNSSISNNTVHYNVFFPGIMEEDTCSWTQIFDNDVLMHGPIIDEIVPSIDENGIVVIEWHVLPGVGLYNVYRATAPITALNVENITLLVTQDTTSHADYTPSNGIFYYVVLMTYKQWMSELSGIVNVTVAVSPGSPILDPITPQVSTTGLVFLSWNDVPFATGYHVYLSTSPISSISYLSPLATITTSSFSRVFDSNGTWYFAIVAFNEIGLSEISNNESVVISIPPPPPTNPLPSIIIIAGWTFAGISIGALGMILLVELFQFLTKREEGKKKLKR